MIYRNFKRDIEVISLEKVLLKPEVKNEEIEGSHFLHASNSIVIKHL